MQPKQTRPNYLGGAITMLVFGTAVASLLGAVLGMGAAVPVLAIVALGLGLTVLAATWRRG